MQFLDTAMIETYKINCYYDDDDDGNSLDRNHDSFT